MRNDGSKAMINKLTNVNLLVLTLACSLALVGCDTAGDSAVLDKSTDAKGSATSGEMPDSPEATDYQIDLAAFSPDAMIKPAAVIDCTLSTGEAAKCAQITVKYKPDNLQIGPFCPSTLDEIGGICPGMVSSLGCIGSMAHFCGC
jgi:hypothetical protein